MASPLPTFERLPCPTVLLRHELPEGDSHIDWLIAREPEGVEPVVSFRLDLPLDKLPVGERLRAERIADHRPEYLDYEGSVSNNRGTVSRLARGAVLEASRAANEAALMLRIRWSGRDTVQILNLTRRNSDQWAISCVKLDELPAHVAAGYVQAKEKP